MSKVGEILKKNREELGLTIDDICKELKISKEVIKNLENDQIKNNSDIIYHIGHLRAYANFINLNSSKIIENFKEQISFKKQVITDQISKPNFEVKMYNYKILSSSLVVIIFFTFYLLFIDKEKNTSQYAMVPDLPESYIPIIEKSTLEISLENKIDKKNISNSFADISSSSAIASNKIEDVKTNKVVTLKLLNPTWVQLRDNSDNIVISKLMEKDEEISYNMNLAYNITAGNAGNILVIIDNIVKGKIGKHGEIIDSFILDNNFNN